MDNIQKIQVGDIYPIPPDGEGFVARMQGQAFHVIGFASNLKAREVKVFKNKPLRYGLFKYVEGPGAVPFFLVRIAGTDWYFDVSFNLPVELTRTWSAFLTAPDASVIVPIILCDFPSGKVRAIRAISVDAETMRDLKATCRAQVDGGVVGRAITECYQRISLEDMLNRTEWRLP